MTPITRARHRLLHWRLVRRGLLEPRVPDLPRIQRGSDSPAVSGPGRAVTNISSAVEAAHDVRVGPSPWPPTHAPGRFPLPPGVVRDPAS